MAPATGRGGGRALVAGALALALVAAPGAAVADRGAADRGAAARVAARPTLPAAPVSGDVIGLLDVRVEGVSETAAELFTKQIEESLEMSGLKVAPRRRLHEHLAGTPWNAACLMGDCLRQLKLRAGVATVLEVALVTTGPSYHYVITMIDTLSGKHIGQIARKCDVCTTEEAFAAAALAIVELVNGVGEAAPTARAPGGDPDDRAAHRVDAARRKARWVSLGLALGALAAGAGSYYFYREDRDVLGGAAAGAAGALGVASVTSFGVSFSF